VVDTAPASTLTRTQTWGFWLYAVVAAVHVGAIALSLEPIVYPTKLMLMPALALAAIWALRGSGWQPAASTLLVAIALSWLGDGAAFFFPFLGDELPAMLLCFGLAHLAYIWVFARRPFTGRLPRWTLVYVAWWIGMIALLLPHLGVLALGVAAYGIVLGLTAAFSARGGLITALGGVLFLASDTLLALRLFLPVDLPQPLTSVGIMLTYTLGQGLLAYGITRALRRA